MTDAQQDSRHAPSRRSRSMPDTVAPEFLRFVASERRANRLPPRPGRMAAGEVAHSISIEHGQASVLLRVAARRAVGLFRPTKRTEVVWVNGDSELAINLTDIHLELETGLILVRIPVRCDQTGNAIVEVP